MDTAIETIDARLAESALLACKRYLAFLDDPNDPETNHKLRVSIRTVRSLLDFTSPWKKRKPCKRAQNELKRVVRETSRLRELDVLCMLARERGAGARLIAVCSAEAASERNKVLEALCSDEIVDALAHAVNEARSMPWKRAVEENGLDARDVRTRFEEMASELESDLKLLDEEDYESVHETRKRVKQVRYVAEQFSPVLGESARIAAKGMKAEQDRLGALCDAKVNHEIVTDFIDRKTLSPRLVKALRSLA